MDAPEDVVGLAEQRATAREARDFDAADALRDRIVERGWAVVDEPGGWHLEPAAIDEPGDLPRQIPVASKDVPSLLSEPATADVSVEWVVEGWPEDVDRALRAFRANAGDRDVQYVVADVTGEDPGRWGDDVEVVSLEKGTGWAAARNAGLKRSRGRLAFAMDGSVEPRGDVFGPLEAALADSSVGICGPFGIVTTDLREFGEASSPGDCDAVEGYMMAFRRELLRSPGLFDEKFRWYRTADIEWSFRVKDAGFRTVVVDVPVEKHEHRMWFATPPDERAKWSKRNYYRFLDRWRDRWDLVLSGEPEHTHDHDGHHDH